MKGLLQGWFWMQQPFWGVFENSFPPSDGTQFSNTPWHTPMD